MDMTTGHFGGSLTEEQRNFYNTEGYLVLEDLLNGHDRTEGSHADEGRCDRRRIGCCWVNYR